MKRSIQVILIIMIFLLSLFSCQATVQIDVNETQAVGPSDTKLPTETEKFVPTNLPQADYGGYEFRILVPINNIYGTFAPDTEEETGEVLNDSFILRDRYVEDKYNIKIKYIRVEDYGQLQNILHKSVSSGSDDFDATVQIDSLAFNSALQGYVLPAEELPYVDLTQPWYIEGVNTGLAVGGKHYIFYGENSMNLYELSCILIYNKKLATDYNIDNLYTMVRSGKWTYDAFYDICKKTSEDLDGDGKMTDVDRYGVVSQSDQFLPNFWLCAGLRTVNHDASGNLVWDIGSQDRIINILSGVYDNIYGAKKVYFDPHIDKATSIKPSNEQDGVRDISRQQFTNGLAFFYSTTAGRIPALRAMDTDFGIIPFPKMDETQANYYTRMGGGWPLVVPSTVTDTERTSIILESLVAESKNLITPTFKQTMLKTKFARDEDSADMLDMIYNNCIMDMGDAIFYNIRNTFIGGLLNGKNTFVSDLEKNINSINKTLSDTNAAVEKLK